MTSKKKSGLKAEFYQELDEFSKLDKLDNVFVQFSIQIPREKILAKIGERFPTATVSILSKFLLEESVGNVLIEIKSSKIAQILSLFETIDQKNILSQTSTSILVNLKMDDPWILNALIKTELLVIYPIVIKNNEIHIKSVANRKVIDSFFESLETLEIPFSIQQIGRYIEEPLLTPYQTSILETAFHAGFYTIPRKINRTKLAERLKISKAALAENIRRIHIKLVKKYLRV